MITTEDIDAIERIENSVGINHDTMDDTFDYLRERIATGDPDAVRQIALALLDLVD